MIKRFIGISLCILILLSTILVNADNNTYFSDLDQNHWAYDAVIDMVDKGIIKGFDDGTFRPDEPVTREQFAKILVLALNLPLQNSDVQTFEDVSKVDWAFPYIESVKQYLTGYQVEDKLYFRGLDQAVREDMAVAIVIAKGLDSQTQDLSVLDQFADKDQISPKLKGYASIAVKNKIMEGDGDYFYPQNTLTRAEACALIYKSSIAIGKGEKVPVKSSEIEANSQKFDDGKITFAYSKDYILNPDDMGAEFTGRGHGNYVEISFDTDIEYTPLISTTLNDIYNAAFNEYGSAIGKTIEKYDNAVVIKTDLEHWYYYDIYGRGIGDEVPHITLMLTTIEMSQEQKAITDKDAAQIINSLVVTSSVQPLSGNPIALQQDKLFNDGNITFKYPDALTFNKSSVVTTEDYQNYEGTFNDIHVKVEYIKWDRYNTDIESIGYDLTDTYTRQKPQVYQGGWVTNVFSASCLDDTKPLQELIYGRGIGDVVPLITISGTRPNNQIYSGDHDLTDFLKIRNKITGSLEVINAIPSN